MEHLSYLICVAVEEGYWKTISLSNGGLPISYLCLTDDLFLFVETSMDQVDIISYYLCYKKNSVLWATYQPQKTKNRRKVGVCSSIMILSCYPQNLCKETNLRRLTLWWSFHPQVLWQSLHLQSLWQSFYLQSLW